MSNQKRGEKISKILLEIHAHLFIFVLNMFLGIMGINEIEKYDYYSQIVLVIISSVFVTIGLLSLASISKNIVRLYRI